ncbi:MAG: cytidine deaminase [Firmicutes bacterium]|nr:cytidine deaminase [Bacillota bacterium]
MKGTGEKELIARATAAREMAYAPYSVFRVGAALRAESGKIYEGCNVENASYGATICAERVAAVKAVAAGERRFLALAVVAEGPPLVPPCGIGRQFLTEFGPDLEVYLADLEGHIERTDLAALFPAAFTRQSLSAKKARGEEGFSGRDG